MSMDELIKEQRDTNRLLKLLIRASLMSPIGSPILAKPNLRVVRDGDFPTTSLTIAPNTTLTLLDLPEKPDTDGDFLFDVASISINSQNVRLTLQSSAKVGKNRPFNFNATQLELAANGFTAPNSFPLWTPLAAGVAGVFTIVASVGLNTMPVIHNRLLITAKNEGAVNAVISTNGLFIAVYEYDQSLQDIFYRVLSDTDPSDGVRIRDNSKKLEEIPAD